ncbi:MAG: class I SAM-dependent methyltransferase [Vicinamibacterales bacterium]
MADDQLSSTWPHWIATRDREIRGRLRAGDEDSLLHFLLYGTSFTTRPRASARDVAAVVTTPNEALTPLRQRVDDFAAALRGPDRGERLAFARHVLADNGIDLDKPSDVVRYLESRVRAMAATTTRTARLLATNPDPVDQLTAFRDRGLSSDTSLFVQFGLERALEALRTRAALGPESVHRVGIVGPGLDFTDKFEGYDFYPIQTIQPFAVMDSLKRLGLAAPGLQVVTFDLSAPVLQHIEGATERARRGEAYVLSLPRSLERAWPSELEAFWRKFGDRIGVDAGPLQAPPNAGKVEGRRVRVQPDVVLRVATQDLNIVLERANLNAIPRFDLIVATNVFLYYDVFEQALAASNTAAMLAPNGLLLTSNRLFELPGGPLEPTATTSVTYLQIPGVGETGDQFVAYRLSGR